MTDTLIVEIIREGAKLKMSAIDKIDQASLTLKHYSELEIQDKEITELSNDIAALLGKASHAGMAEQNLLSELKKTGQLLFDQLLTIEVKEKLHTISPNHLIFSTDEKLVQIPWELLFDGDEFLCLKYALGRMVRTKQKSHTIQSQRPPASCRKMLIIADPTGDLEEAYREGVEIRNDLDKQKNRINVDLHATELDVHFFKKNVHDYDIVHFAGHADYDENPSESGWRFKEGKLTAKEIVQLGGASPLPTLVFSNACESAKTEEWKTEKSFEDKIYGLANAFLLAGTKHYIGTFWKVADKSGFLFAKEFYKQLIQGASIGDAVKLARKSLAGEFGDGSIVWASYLLYGDPTTVFFPTQAQRALVDQGFRISRSTQYLMAAVLLAAAIILAAFFSKSFLAGLSQLKALWLHSTR